MDRFPTIRVLCRLRARRPFNCVSNCFRLRGVRGRLWAYNGQRQPPPRDGIHRVIALPRKRCWWRRTIVKVKASQTFFNTGRPLSRLCAIRRRLDGHLRLHWLWAESRVVSFHYHGGEGVRRRSISAEAIRRGDCAWALGRRTSILSRCLGVTRASIRYALSGAREEVRES